MSGTLDVWWVDLAPAQSATTARAASDLALDGPLAAVLDAGELARARRLASPHDARRFVLSHAATRMILATYVGTDPAALAWDVGMHGKPGALDGGRLRWNLSHSGERAAVAVSTSVDVGVDVQVLDARVDTDRLARRFFHGTASPQAGAEPRRTVFQALARKEACAKAVGGRLLDVLDLGTHAVDTHAVDLPALGTRALGARTGVVTSAAGPWAGRTWWLSDLDVPGDHVGALAAPGEVPHTVRTIDFTWPARRGAP